MRPSRRSFVLGASACLVASRAAAQMAKRELIPFGAAVMISDFQSDATLRDNLVKLCDIIVPMNELKWEWLRQDRTGYRFEQADEIIGFARKHGKRTHGHAMLWGEALPPWAKQLTDAREAERELVKHIETVAGKYAGIIPTWDVVNEVIASTPTPDAPYRDSVWFRLLGPRLVDLAFQTAARADPAAKLVLNDYALEAVEERTPERRRQVLRLVRHLQDRNIPVHQIGFQAHLYGEKAIDQRGLTAFCRELGRLGVGVRVSELDVIDWKLPGDIAQRDKMAADATTAFLGAMIEGQRPEAIITWGLTDRSTWVNETFKRQDRLKARPLPLDADYRPKPMLAAIQAARMLVPSAK